MNNLLQICLFLTLAPSMAFFAPVTTARRTFARSMVKEEFSLSSPPSLDSKAGKADTAFGKRFGHLAGKPIKTVSESMKIFSEECGGPINALYRNYLTDLVATTHLSVVDARFVMDPVWALGFTTVTDVLLKNYPEKEFAEKMVSSLAKAVDLDYNAVKQDAGKISEWAQGKSAEDVAAALRGEGSSEISSIANAAKGDEFWLYTRFFGIGLIKIMEITGTEVTDDVMNKWVKEDMGKSSQKATADLDQWNGLNSKLTMMETLMKEIEIREKKKMAERLEDKAKAAIAKAEREKKVEEALKVED
ncbi:hypothetical protein TrRE_jg3211 [Triparma retinervis]|uniref:Uncharacterized protein n=1 Tax=Triparma retinervis TaxID=2557542 RepID=A0A9W6ZCA3_9STRA|nr:hypothetical protein TrRE_jg3211 [Triparma retinervis]